MISIFGALAIGLGVFAFIWYTVTKRAIVDFKGAPLTFTPVAYKPALDSQGALQWDAEGDLIEVPTGEFVSFEPRHERYMKIAEVGTTLASASLIFVPNSRLSVYPRSCAFALALLGLSVLFCILFMAMLTTYYEGFQHFRKSYSPTRYGLVNALGFSGLICFALAYLWLAVRVGWALIYAHGS